MCERDIHMLLSGAWWPTRHTIKKNVGFLKRLDCHWNSLIVASGPPLRRTCCCLLHMAMAMRKLLCFRRRRRSLQYNELAQTIREKRWLVGRVFPKSQIRLWVYETGNGQTNSSNHSLLGRERPSPKHWHCFHTAWKTGFNQLCFFNLFLWMWIPIHIVTTTFRYI